MELHLEQAQHDGIKITKSYPNPFCRKGINETFKSFGEDSLAQHVGSILIKISYP